MRSGTDCKGNAWVERPIGRMRDLTGRRFTKLTVLFPVYVSGRSEKHYYWLCVCDCGNYITCRIDCLQNQHIQSCGCMTVEGVYKKSRTLAEQMIGKRCGKLIIDEFVGYKVGRSGRSKAMFKCFCDCGGSAIVSGNALNTGLTISCGCLTRSVGEENIEKLLKDNHIHFKPECGFTDLISERDGHPRYDFAILDDADNPIRLIEFDGEQHFKPIDMFGGQEQFEILQQNDALKDQYALSHNIPLVRIPYSLRDNITLEDLMGDKYLITIKNNEIGGASAPPFPI